MSKLKPILFLLPFLTACRHPAFPGYPDGFRQFAYIANSAANTVTVLDLVYLRTDRTLQVGDNPIAIVKSPTRPEAYVLSRHFGASSGSVAIIDTDSNQVVDTIALRREPAALSVDPTGHRAYIANAGSNSISVLDLNIRRTIASYATSSHPTSALLSPDGHTLLVTHPETGQISLFTAALPQVNAPALAARATFSGCPGATSPVILPDSSKAFIACPAANHVQAISLAAPPDSKPAQQNPSLATDHPLALLDVGKNPTFLALKPDGGEIFVSNTASGSISEIDATNNQVGNTFPIGNRPAAALISADNSTLWVANAGADSLSLYSIDDGKLVGSLHIGADPSALAFSQDPPAGQPQRLLLATDRASGDVALIRTSEPGLFTMLPAGQGPAALAIQSSTSPH